MEKTLKRQRFEKVASSRVQKIINTLVLLQNCSNRNNYEYDENDVDYMFNEISRVLKETRTTFNTEINRTNKTGFSFK